jgi:hypothetical protein
VLANLLEGYLGETALQLPRLFERERDLREDLDFSLFSEDFVALFLVVAVLIERFAGDFELLRPVAFKCWFSSLIAIDD